MRPNGAVTTGGTGAPQGGPPPGNRPLVRQAPDGRPPQGRVPDTRAPRDPAANGRPPIAPPGNGRPPAGRRADPRAPHPNLPDTAAVAAANGRGAVPIDDEPTVVDGKIPDLTEADDGSADANPDINPEVPGRHRRRAGRSPDARPASAYQKQAAAEGRKSRGGRRRRPTFWKELPILIVVALLLTFLIQTFLAKVYVIPSGSMETTLHGCTGCNNDRVLVDKISYRFTDPSPGDVVVFRGPDSWNKEFTAEEPSNIVVKGLQQLGSLIGLAPPDERDFVKRVIAVGGQTVQCCDSRNRILVDGQPLNEPYIYYLPEAGQARQDPFGPITVPAGQLWMMGDSRNNSADSRVHGPVPVDDVIGKARLIVLPFPRFGWIAAVDPHSTAVGMPAQGTDPTAPLGLGLVAAVPLLLGRRRLDRLDADLLGFLPARRSRRRR
jgi:signal peptidase I